MNFADDRYRPIYHFSPPLGWWGGGPDGTIHHNGEYHVFYQYDPYMGSSSGSTAWGHTVSRDLVHWEHRPVVLGPTVCRTEHYQAFAQSNLLKQLDRSRIPPVLYDREICFSGSTVINNGVPTITYTGILSGVQDVPIALNRSQCLATSDDGMMTWRKHESNPVIPHPPPELVDPAERDQPLVWNEVPLPSPRRWVDHRGKDRAFDGRRLDAVEDDRTRGQITAWHDPHVWQEGDTWYMALGCGFLGMGGALLLYRSPDLIEWKYLHPLCVGTEPEFNRWLVPDFFPLGDRHVLLTAATTRGESGKVIYMTGCYDDHRFTPQVEGFLDAYPMAAFHCARTLLDSKGRRIMVGLLAERRVIADNPHGWAGVLSLPRVLDLDADGRLLMDPAPEVCSTHEADWEYHGALSARAPLIPADLYEDSLELVMEIDPGSAGDVGVKLRSSPGGEEETAIRYDTENQNLTVDTRKASLNLDTGRSVNGTPLALKSGELLRLHVFLDRSTVEVFANRRACVSDRLYPTRDDSLGVEVYARGGDATITTLKAWRKKSVFFTS